MSVRLERMIAMDAAIRANTYPSVRTFIDRFEISERTVRLDLAFMRERLNAPLDHHRSRGNSYRLRSLYKIALIRIWLLP